MNEGPLGPATDLLTGVQYELIALNEQMRELLAKVAQAPQVTVEPAPVSVQSASVDFSPLLDALAAMDRKDDNEELKGLRKEFNDLATSIRAIAGNSGGTYGIGASIVTAGGDFPVKNSDEFPLHVTVDTGHNMQVEVTDYFNDCEVLEDQAGAGDVLTFTFTSTPKMIWILSRGGVSRATTTQTPTSTFGVYCDDGVPQPFSVESQTVQLYAPSGATVTVWGFS